MKNILLLLILFTGLVSWGQRVNIDELTISNDTYSLNGTYQSNWDGKYPWYSADRYGDIRRGISYMSSVIEVYYLDEVKNMNKFQKSVDTLIFSENDKFLEYFFDFENKKVTVINLRSKTTEVYDVLRIKKRKVNKEKTEGVFTLKIKKGKTKINYYINTYDRYFCKIIYSKEEKMGVVLFNNVAGTGYKTDEN